MRFVGTLLFAALALAPAACKKDNKETPAAPAGGSGSGSGAAMAGSNMAGSGSAGSAMAGSDMAGSGSAAMAGSGAGSGSGADAAMAHHAGNCPSTVLGSTTKAEVKGKAVIVTVSSDDKDAIKAIQARTDEMLKARLGTKTTGEGHDQRGTHGGKVGLCPMHIPEGATAKAAHEKNGVKVTITPKDKPDELKKEIDERITKSADWVKANIKPGDDKNEGGVGGGKGKDGSNHSGKGDGKGQERNQTGGDGGGGGKGTGGGGGKGTGGGGGSGSAKK